MPTGNPGSGATQELPDLKAALGWFAWGSRVRGQGLGDQGLGFRGYLPGFLDMRFLHPQRGGFSGGGSSTVCNKISLHAQVTRNHHCYPTGSCAHIVDTLAVKLK